VVRLVSKSFPLDDKHDVLNKNEILILEEKPVVQIDNSQQSTAGETSSDESIYEARLSRPGLTMEGMIDDRMFDIILEEEDDAAERGCY
jgi:hypothetical protein